LERTPATLSSSPASASPARGTGAGRAPARQKLFEGRGWLFLRFGTDAVLLMLGNVAALVGAPDRPGGLDGMVLIWLFPPLVLALLVVWGMYRETIGLNLAGGLAQVVGATSLGAISMIATAALIEPESQPALLLARAWLFGTGYVLGGRAVLGWLQLSARATRLIAKRTLIVGAGRVGAHVERRLFAQPELGLLPVGYLDADPAPHELAPERHAPVLGSPDDLGRIARETEAKHVVLGFSSAPDRDLIPLVQECEALGLEISVVPRLFENINVHVGLEHIGGLPLYGLRSIDPKGWQFAVKHVIDRVGAMVFAIVLSPVLLALAIAVKLNSPGPVLFRQLRVGRDGREFEILKFRSMTEPEESSASPSTPGDDVGPGGVEDFDRVTRVGLFLRSHSIDELPQLWNVLRGEMSLVGPRPERPEFTQLFAEQIYRYKERQKVKSGMTGWAQIHGLRGNTSLRDRVEWDNYYIQNWSLWLDLVILLTTISVVFRRGE
jgi:exopolysaccharide biosynthesis polyprenyl glycosylphosphotransferase